VDEVKALVSWANGACDGRLSLPNTASTATLPAVLKERGDEIAVFLRLRRAEEEFHLVSSNGTDENGIPAGRKLFLLRNLTRNKGVGFFNQPGSQS